MALDTDQTGHLDPPLLRVTGPADLAQAIPYLLGFHPTRSLVVVGLRAKRVTVTARIDLDDLDNFADTPVLAETLTSFVHSGAEKLVGVVFDDSVAPRDDHGCLAWSGVADDIHAAAGRLGLDVDEVALVSGGLLWSYDCDDPRCCPPHGRPLDTDSHIAASATYAGLVALPDRASLVELLVRRIRPDELPRLGRLLRARQKEMDRADQADGAGERDQRDRADAETVVVTAGTFDQLSTDAELSEQQRVDFAVALRRIAVRDEVWMALDAGQIDGRALWRRLGTSLPAPYDAAPLFLYAWASYRDGDGASARIAAERALESDPHYTAADLVLAALSQALDPRRLPRFTGRELRAAPPAARPAGATRRPR